MRMKDNYGSGDTWIEEYKRIFIERLISILWLAPEKMLF